MKNNLTQRHANSKHKLKEKGIDIMYTDIYIGSICHHRLHLIHYPMESHHKLLSLPLIENLHCVFFITYDNHVY